MNCPSNQIYCLREGFGIDRGVLGRVRGLPRQLLLHQRAQPLRGIRPFRHPALEKPIEHPAGQLLGDLTIGHVLVLGHPVDDSVPEQLLQPFSGCFRVLGGLCLGDLVGEVTAARWGGAAMFGCPSAQGRVGIQTGVRWQILGSRCGAFAGLTDPEVRAGPFGEVAEEVDGVAFGVEGKGPDLGETVELFPGHDIGESVGVRRVGVLDVVSPSAVHQPEGVPGNTVVPCGFVTVEDHHGHAFALILRCVFHQLLEGSQHVLVWPRGGPVDLEPP